MSIKNEKLLAELFGFRKYKTDPLNLAKISGHLNMHVTHPEATRNQKVAEYINIMLLLLKVMRRRKWALTHRPQKST